MPNADLTHFDVYREQNRIKHNILTKYLDSYLNVLKTWNVPIFYVDGFAGRGHYGDSGKGTGTEGSPLLALQTIYRKTDLRSRVHTVFVEQDQEHFDNLKASVDSFCKINKGILEPHVENGAFSETLKPAIQEVEDGGGELVPVFLFVDPCGVDGVDFEVITKILRSPGSEVLIFFNYVGVSRICGLFKSNRNTPSLVTLFGKQQRVDDLKRFLSEKPDPTRREQRIVQAYLDALQEDGQADYLIAFRVESEGKKATSHYIIHASKHALGFKIMKDVMWEEGRNGGEEGGLELLQASKVSGQLFARPDLANLDETIVDHLRNVRIESVATFTDQWARRPSDQYSSSCYKRRICELEARGVVSVLDADRKTIKPAAERMRMNKKYSKKIPTLADRLFVKIVERD